MNALLSGGLEAASQQFSSCSVPADELMPTHRAAAAAAAALA